MNLSICYQAMRTIHWVENYAQLKEACKKYTWELCLVGPFDPPAEMASYKNFKFDKSLANPSACLQHSVALAEGELFFNGADDAKYLADSVDIAVDRWDEMDNPKAIVNMRYTEGANFTVGTHHSLQDYWWYASTHEPLRRPGIPGHYRMCLNPLMRIDYFKDLGGIDCAYEHPNFNIHDFMFRAQADGAVVELSPATVMACDHYDAGTMMGEADHYPIPAAYHLDIGRWNAKYGNPDALRPDALRLDFNHYKDYMGVWKLRFNDTIYQTYEEMLLAHGYKKE